MKFQQQISFFSIINLTLNTQWLLLIIKSKKLTKHWYKIYL